MVWLAFMLLLCSCGAEIMENHQDNLWSLSAQKYFWLKEPKIIKKILIGFLPVRANKAFAFGAFMSSYSISAMPRLSSRVSELLHTVLSFMGTL